MTYTPHEWSTGEIVTAVNLNHAEEGIEAVTAVALDQAEKDWVTDQVFDAKFSCVITPASTSVSALSATSPIVFTLTTKYGSENVDLDSVPSGWTKTPDTTGIYTKSVAFDLTAGTQPKPSSGSVACTYNGRTKTAANSVTTITKPAYIVTYDEDTITPALIPALIAQSNTVAFDNVASMPGDRTITGTADKYVFYIVPQYKTITVKQVGTSIVGNAVTLNDIEVSNKNIGDYYYYRTDKNGVNSVTATIA